MPDSSPRMITLEKLLAEHTAPAAAELVRADGDKAVRCLACGHRCRVVEGRDGVCRMRFNRGGELRVPFGYVAGLAVDPIEKKPFYHVLPGQDALSFGMLGCNFHCPFCQNWVSSQTLKDGQAIAQPTFVTPEQVAQLAQEHHCPIITSTYNEPLITSEWSVAIFRLCKQQGMRCGFVSNGHATPEVLEFLRPTVDMMNIDLKSFRDPTYRKLGGLLENVLDTIRRAHEMGYWIEIITLVVPTLNDSDEELTEIAEFIAGVSPDIPWHVTAFHPTYKMTEPPRTPPETLIRAFDLGRRAGLRHVYTGNLPGMTGARESTFCPDCGRELVERRGFGIRRNHLRAGHCPDCGAGMAGIWS